TGAIFAAGFGAILGTNFGTALGAGAAGTAGRGATGAGGAAGAGRATPGISAGGTGGACAALNATSEVVRAAANAPMTVVWRRLTRLSPTSRVAGPPRRLQGPRCAGQRGRRHCRRAQRNQ